MTSFEALTNAGIAALCLIWTALLVAWHFHLFNPFSRSTWLIITVAIILISTAKLIHGHVKRR